MWFYIYVSNTWVIMRNTRIPMAIAGISTNQIEEMVGLLTIESLQKMWLITIQKGGDHADLHVVCLKQ